MEGDQEEIRKAPLQLLKKEFSRRRVEVTVPEELRRELVGEKFFATLEEAGQKTIDGGREHGFVAGLRLKNLVPFEVATSEIVEGDETSIKLSLARLKLENNLDVVSLLLLHTHPPGGPIQLSEDDIKNWKEEQKRPPASIENPQDGNFMRATNARPVMMMLTPDPKDLTQSSLIALVQTEEAKLEGSAVELAFDLVAGASLDEKEKLVRLREGLAKLGFQIGHFTLGQREKIQEFIFEHLPEKLILEEAGIPRPRGGPDLSFLEK